MFEKNFGKIEENGKSLFIFNFFMWASNKILNDRFMSVICVYVENFIEIFDWYRNKR